MTRRKIAKIETYCKIEWDDGNAETVSLADADMSPFTLNLETREGFERTFGHAEKILVEMRNEAGQKLAQIFLDSFADPVPGAQRTCEVESELGRPRVHVTGTLASSLRPKERLYSLGIEQLLAQTTATYSYRDSVNLLNRAFHRTDTDGIQSRTLANWVERTGEEAHTAMIEHAECVLNENGFDPKTGKVAVPYGQLSFFVKGLSWPHDLTSEQWQKAQEVIRTINAPGKEPVSINLFGMSVERKKATVYLSADEICVDKQKGTRKGIIENAEEEGSFLWHTNIHIRWYEGSVPRTWVFTAQDRCEAWKTALAFLIENDLLMNDLVFLLDGAQDLKAMVRDLFWFHPYTIILDWFHVKKKLGEYLSGAMVSAELRKTVYSKLLGFLWAGDVNGARTYIKSLPDSDIRNKQKLKKVLGYLDRKAPDMACYAIRAALNLPNSSSPVEKTNDLLVAKRQKHNGMSWTVTGSSAALATLQMLERNGQADEWFSSRTFSLKVS